MIEVTAAMLNAYEDAAERVAGERVRCYGAGLAAVLAIVERDMLARVEGKRGEGLCTCSDADDPPINVRTGLPMDHHCDCDAP